VIPMEPGEPLWIVGIAHGAQSTAIKRGRPSRPVLAFPLKRKGTAQLGPSL
jgi:hypothetical protein